MNISQPIIQTTGSMQSFIMNMLNNLALTEQQNTPNQTGQQNTPINNQPVDPNIPINNLSANFMNDNTEKYKDEIKTLKDMGFTDEQKILEGLIVSDGDINNAIHYCLN